MRHGLDEKRVNKIAPLTVRAGELIKNAILLNEAIPKKKTVSNELILFAMAQNEKNEPYVVRFVVDEISNELITIDVLHAIDTRKRPAALEGPQIADEPLLVTGHDISIADFLDYVNYYFPDVLPMNVLQHYGYSERPQSDLQGLRYSLDTAEVSKEQVAQTKRRLPSADAEAIGGGESAVRYSLGFYSKNNDSINRIGWSKELFSAEDKKLLNDRIVDIMVRKNRGDAIWLPGNSYVVDVNNKVVIVGGSFKKPIIHYVAILNAGSATEAAIFKEVLLDENYVGGFTAIQAAAYCDIYAAVKGEKHIRTYSREDFVVSKTAKGNTRRYADAPVGFKSYGYTGTQRDGSGISEEDGSNGKVRFSLDVATVSEEKVAEKKRRLPSADAEAIGVHTARMDETARNDGRIPQGESD